MPKKSFVSAQNYFVAMKKCPVCNSIDGVREYLYGMPMEEPDPRMFVVGVVALKRICLTTNASVVK